MSREADPLTGTSTVQFQRGGNNARAPAQEIADLTGMTGGEVVRIRRGKRWDKTTTADIAGGINGGDIVTIKQGRRHVRTTAQSIADLGASYEGPLDLVPDPEVAYSVARALSAARIGQPVVRLLRDSDDEELDFVAAVNGSVSVAAVTAWLGGANGFIVTLYDQSGNGKDATLAEDFLAWIASSQGGRPAMGGSNTYLSAGTFSVLGGEFTGFVIGKGEGTISAESDAGTTFVLTGGGSATIYADDLAGDTAGALYTLDNDTYRILDGKVAFGTVNVKANGLTLTPDSSRDAGGLLGTLTDLRGMIGSGVETQEGFFYTGLMSDANRLAIRQNIATYYGITL